MVVLANTDTKNEAAIRTLWRQQISSGQYLETIIISLPTLIRPYIIIISIIICHCNLLCSRSHVSVEHFYFILPYFRIDIKTCLSTSFCDSPLRCGEPQCASNGQQPSPQTAEKFNDCVMNFVTFLPIIIC